MMHHSRNMHFRYTLAAAASFLIVLLTCALAHAGMGFRPGTALTANTGHDRSPDIATDGAGHWIAVWHSNDDIGGTIGTDQDILCARSSDNGATWTAPAAVNSYATSDTANDQYPDVASNGAGAWVVVWECWGGAGGSDSDPMSARSTDNGATWGTATLVKTDGASDSAESDSAPRVAGDATGKWIVVWTTSDYPTDAYHVDDDVAFARSTDNAVTWSPMAPVNEYAITDEGEDRHCDIKTDGAGTWVCVWAAWWRNATPYQNDADIVFARSTNAGATWTPTAVLSPSGNTDTNFVDDYHPSLAVSGNGVWLAVWESNNTLGGTIGGDNDILVARSTNNGATWSTVAAVDTGATADTAEDTYAQIAADAAGHWTAVWETMPTSGGDYDFDVRCATLDRVTDTDHDGLPDSAETNTGTYRDSWDTGTNPNDTDTDNDGLPDGWEVHYALNPLLTTGVNGATGNPDGDYFNNLQEYQGGSDPTDPASIPAGATLPAATPARLAAAIAALLLLGLQFLPQKHKS
jgi:hypothetical protein